MRNNFHLKFKEWEDRKKLIGRYFSKPQNLPQKKLVKDEDFEEEKKIAEEQKQKEMEEKKKKKKERRHVIAAKNKELKQVKKAEKNKRDKQEMWARLKKLNNNFAKMKEQTKLVKKKKLYFS